MSGSNRYFNYVTDGGQTYAIFASKDNVAGANSSAPIATLGAATVPRNITPRYALFADDSGLIKRKVPILNQASITALSGTTSYVPYGETATVRLTSYHGEVVKLPKLADTARTV